MQVGVRPQSGNLLLTTQFVTCYTNCVLSSTFRDSTCHMEGVTIFKVNLNLSVYIYRYTLIIVTPSIWYVETH